MTALTVEDLSKTFQMHELGGKRVVGLDDVSFTVDEGEFLAIVGESGSGKSSLLKCIYRTYDPTSGRVVLHRSDGTTDLAESDEREVLTMRMTTIGYTAQFLDEIPRVPAVDVVARPLRERGTPIEEARERAEELLELLHLPEDLWDAYPATFSGGERQRVNLAQAVAPRPDLLLLDEPTSALDPETRAAAIDLLESVRDGRTAIVGVFHDHEVIETVADRVLVLDDASVARIVPIEEFEGRVIG